MARLTPEQLRAAKADKRERIKRSLVAAMLGDDREIKATIDEINDVFAALIESALWYWFREKLPQHFGPGASQKYGFPERKQGYMVAKFTGHTMSGKQSHFRFPKSVAYRMASYAGRGDGTGDDPYPLEFSGSLKSQVTNAPAQYPRVRPTARGYIGEIIFSLPAYIRREDIDALLRDTPHDLAEMIGIVQMGVQEIFGG